MGSFATTPFGLGTFGIQPIAQQSYLQPFSSQGIGAYGAGGAQLLPHTVQLLQIVTQQLQQLQYLQQQQLVQLHQIQQLIHTVPNYLQSLQQQSQPFGTIGSPLGFGMSPSLAASAGQVM